MGRVGRVVDRNNLDRRIRNRDIGDLELWEHGSGFGWLIEGLKCRFWDGSRTSVAAQVLEVRRPADG